MCRQCVPQTPVATERCKGCARAQRSAESERGFSLGAESATSQGRAAPGTAHASRCASRARRACRLAVQRLSCGGRTWHLIAPALQASGIAISDPGLAQML